MKASKYGQSYDQILGVNQDTILPNIEAASRKKKDDYNPQKLPDIEDNALGLVKVETERIKKAYEVLKNPESERNTTNRPPVMIPLQRNRPNSPNRKDL